MAKQPPEKPQQPPVNPDEGSEEDKPTVQPDVETMVQVPAEILEKLPPEDQKRIRRTFSQFSSMMWAGPMPNPVLSKVTSQHIADMIALADKESEREHETEGTTRRYVFSVFLISILVILGLLIYLVERGQMAIAQQIIIALGGMGAGFGLSRLTARR